MASILLLSALFSCILHAQDDAIGLDESALQDSQTQIDIIEYFSMHPIQLDQSPNDLSLIPGFFPALIESIRKTLRLHPDIQSTQELIEKLPFSLDSSIAQLLITCSTISHTTTKIHGRYRARVSASNPIVKGFAQNVFEGSHESFMQRLFIGNTSTRFSISFGKHSGERYQHGMIHVSLMHKQKDFSFIVGDHSLECGLGTLLASGISFPDMARPALRADYWSTAVKPTTSLIEHPNFRGISVMYQPNNSMIPLRAGLSISDRKRFAYRNTNGEVTGFPTIAYARTESELENRDGVKEQKIAFFTNLQLGMHTGSIAGLYQYYDSEISPQSIAIKEREQFLISMDYRYGTNRYSLSANVLCDKRGRLGGMLMFHHEYKYHHQGVIFRYFDSRLYSPVGMSPGRYGNPNNDIGIQFLVNGKAISFHYALSSEIYSTVNIPANGFNHKQGIRSILQTSRTTKQQMTLLRIIHELKSQTNINQASESDWRCRAEHQFIGSILRMAFRAETHIVNQGNNSRIGYGFSMEMKSMKEKDSPWFWSFRMAWGSTDEFDTAIYLPETGLPGQLLIDPLYGITTMLGLQVRYSMRNSSISVLIRQKHKPRELSMGSGWMEMKGNLETEFHVQTDINF